MLQVYISQLRGLLKPERRPSEAPRERVGRAGGYVLIVEPEQIDLERFRRLATAGREALAAGEPQEGENCF